MKRLVLFCLFAIGLTGCLRHLHSPPARIAPLEPAETLDQSTTSGEIQAGFRSGLFGPEVGSLSARVRHGATEEIEAGVDLNVARFMGETDNVYVDHDQNIYSARGSVKWAPEATAGYLAVVGGLGGGTHAAGGFLSPDLGLVLSYEWYFTPIVAISGFLSVPIGAESIDIRENEMSEPLFDEPELTYGYTLSFGGAIPIGPVDFLIGFSFDHLIDSEEEIAFYGAHAGWRFRFQ